MHKGLGKKQQVRGHKRTNKILTMKKNRNPNAEKPQPGTKYLEWYLASE